MVMLRIVSDPPCESEGACSALRLHLRTSHDLAGLIQRGERRVAI